MNRRAFMAALGAAGAAHGQTGDREVFVERVTQGKPRAAKVVAAIQPHADDIPLFAGGTVAKLLDEGASGYLINVTNDDMAGSGTIAETALANERDVDALVNAMGFRRVFTSITAITRWMVSRARSAQPTDLPLCPPQVDTVFCYDPWGHYEENPDHYVTAQCVAAACWMAGMDKDYPEHFAAGLKPKSVQEKYYFARGPQLVNRAVDIGAYVEKKIDANLVNKAQGPAGRPARACAATWPPATSACHCCGAGRRTPAPPTATTSASSCWTATARRAASTAWSTPRPSTISGPRLPGGRLRQAERGSAVTSPAVPAIRRAGRGFRPPPVHHRTTTQRPRTAFGRPGRTAKSVNKRDSPRSGLAKSVCVSVRIPHAEQQDMPRNARAPEGRRRGYS